MRDNLIFPALTPRNTGLLGPATIVVELDQDINTLHVEDILPKISVELETWCLENNVDTTVIEATIDRGEDYFKAVSPYLIRTSFRCSTMGSDPEELQARAELALALATEKAIEREMWSGPLAGEAPDDSRFNNKYLLDEDVVLIPGTYSPGAGVAVLEGAYADKSHGILPTIYSPRSAATLMPLDNLPEKPGFNTTLIGTPVIAGSGFNAVPGKSGATLSDNTQVLAVISGPTVVILGETVITPDEQYQAVNWQKNDIQYFAERSAVAFTLGGDKFATVIDVTK